MKDKIILDGYEFDVLGWKLLHQFATDAMTVNVKVRNFSNEQKKCSSVLPEIENVMYNDPATIVFWSDHTKTVAKCSGGDTYNPEMGLMVCIAKKYFGNYEKFRENFEKWSTKAPEKPKEKYYNGRVVCVWCPALTAYTKGKIYEVIDGQLILDNGCKHPSTPVKTIGELQARCSCGLREIKE